MDFERACSNLCGQNAVGSAGARLMKVVAARRRETRKKILLRARGFDVLPSAKRVCAFALLAVFAAKGDSGKRETVKRWAAGVLPACSILSIRQARRPAATFQSRRFFPLREELERNCNRFHSLPRCASIAPTPGRFQDRAVVFLSGSPGSRGRAKNTRSRAWISVSAASETEKSCERLQRRNRSGCCCGVTHG